MTSRPVRSIEGAGAGLQADQAQAYRNQTDRPVTFTMTAAQPVSNLDLAVLEGAGDTGDQLPDRA